MVRTSTIAPSSTTLGWFVLFALLGACGPARATPAIPSDGAATGTALTVEPAGAVRELQATYRARDLARFGALLADDYHFHCYDETGRYWNLEGFDRGSELGSAHCMFGSTPPDTNCSKSMPAPQSIDCRMTGLHLAEDPEHPDSTAQYAIVIAERFQIFFDLPDSLHIETTPGQHVFHVVRGDVALLSHGQPADSLHWYLRRWIAYTDAPGPTGPGAPTPAAGPGVLAVRPVANPSDRDLAVFYSLPGAGPAELAVFDVQGRRCVSRTLHAQDAGENRIAMGTGAHLRPGIYWLHLAQPGQRAVARMVVVR